MKDISINIVPPSNEKGTHELEFTVTAGSDYTSSATLRLDVEDREPPEASSFYPDKIVETGDSVQFEVDILNPADQAIEFWLELQSDRVLPGDHVIMEKAIHTIFIANLVYYNFHMFAENIPDGL